MDELVKRLPFKQVSVPLPSGSRHLTGLDIELKRFSADLFPKNIPTLLVQSPFLLHLYLVNCDVSLKI